MSHTIEARGDDTFLITIDLTNAGAGTFEQMEVPFKKGILLRHQSHLTAGTATAINSVITREQGVVVGIPVQLEADPLDPGLIDDRIDVAPSVAIVTAITNVDAPTGRLWFYPRPDAGADNSITATLLIQRL